MSAIFFWTGSNYYSDMIEYGKSYALNQNRKLLTELKQGEHLWAFTRRKDGVYVLACDLVVNLMSLNTPLSEEYKYGEYKVEGNEKLSRYFDIDHTPDVEPIIRSMSFMIMAARKSTARKRIPSLGQYFQGLNGVRQLSDDDEKRLETFAKYLPVI